MTSCRIERFVPPQLGERRGTSVRRLPSAQLDQVRTVVSPGVAMKPLASYATRFVAMKNLDGIVTTSTLILLAGMSAWATVEEPAAKEKSAPAHPVSYTTHFPLAENPISEHGHWINGKKVALDWGDISTIPGLAIGHAGPARYADATALLMGTWGPNQSAEATVSVGKTFGSPEVELRLRSSLSAHVATGYEISNSVSNDASAYLIIVRWNGPLAEFTYLANLHGQQYGVKTGDVVKATIVGNVITAYKNGVPLAQVTDKTYSTGNPGMGFNEGTNGDYGFTSFSASDTFITSPLSARATVGSAFSYQIAATNNPTSYNATGLPSGLTVSKATGRITGTPGTAGISTVTLNATNASGTATASLAITVVATVVRPAP
jgi:hypothetical protein